MSGWRKRTIVEMAKESGFIDADWNYTIIVPHLEAFAKLVREDALAQPAPVRDTEAHYKAVVEGVQKLFNDKRTQPAPVQEPVGWMEMVVANLVREGVNKHKARALAEHFYTTPPQRTWVGLTEEDLKILSTEWRIVYGAWMDDFARDIETRLKDKNNAA
jgi:hypothetical protein